MIKSDNFTSREIHILHKLWLLRTVIDLPPLDDFFISKIFFLNQNFDRKDCVSFFLDAN